MVTFNRLAKRALESVGVYRRRLAARPYPGVAVLTYHAIRDAERRARAVPFAELHVTAARLDEHCRVLRDLGCTPIALADWAAIAAGERPLPQRAVMLTFDDGYRSVLRHGVPVLERWRFPATVFVCTSPVERQVRFWFDAMADAEGEAAVQSARMSAYYAWRALADAVETPASPDTSHAPLDVSELRTLADHPLIAIGAHTLSHPRLMHAPRDVQRNEIAGARWMLETWIGRRVSAFAYPNGRPGVDYDGQVVEVVRGCGFEHAFTTAERFARPGHQPLEQPRFTMLQGISASELAHRLAVSWPRADAGTC